MRVLMVAFYYAPARDGLSRQTHLLARMLVAQGVTVTTLTQGAPGLARDENVDGVRVVRLPVPAFGGYRTRAYPFIAGMTPFMLSHRDEFDVVHAHQALQHAAAAVALARVLGKPSIVKVAGGGYTGNVAFLQRWWPGGALSLRALRLATRIISLSSEIADELRSVGIEDAKIVRMPNGIDLGRFQGERDQAARRGVRAVVTAARLSREKAIDVLVDAWPSVVARFPDATLTILGAGPEASNLAARVRELGLNDSVQMPGEVDNVVPYLARSIFVLPSHYGEGMSNALLEAMALGCPVVVSDIAPNTNIVQDGRNGLTFGVRDSAQLAQRIIELLATPELAETVGRNAAEMATGYSIETIAARYRALYDELVGRGRVTPR